MIANQLHINIEASLKPNKATIYCKEKGGVAVKLGNHIDIATNLPPMDKAVIIGKEEGYKAAYLEDIKWLNEVLPKYNDSKIFIPVLTDAESTAIIRAKSMVNNLNEPAKRVANKHLKLLEERDTVVEFIELNSVKLSANDIDSKNALLALLVKHGFVKNGAVPTVDKKYTVKFKETGNRCIDAQFQSNPICDDNKSSQEWVVDGVGKIHLATSPNLCLSNGGGYLHVIDCSDMIVSKKHWIFDGKNQSENKYLIKSKAEDWRCIDYATGEYNTFLPYNCHGNSNQRFEITNKAGKIGFEDKLLSIISGKELKIIYDLFK